jgi:hypothetical protein
MNTYDATPAEKQVNANIVAGNLAPGEIKRYGALCNGASYTPDTQAVLTATSVANAAYALGDHYAIYFPLGVTCLLQGMLFNPGVPCKVYGAGIHHSFIRMGTASFDLAIWADCWRSGSYTTGSFDPTKDKAGAMLDGITVWGDQSGKYIQNAFRFMDHHDFVAIGDIECFYVNGMALDFGTVWAKGGKEAYVRESRIAYFRPWWCGTASVPAVNFGTTASGGDGTNEIDVGKMNVFADKGDGVVITNPVNAGGGNRLYDFDKLRVESNGGAGIRVGKKTDAGFTGIVVVKNFQAPNIKAGDFAVSVANNGTKKGYSTAFHNCNMGSGTGNGFELINSQGFYASVLNMSVQTPVSQSGSSNYLVENLQRTVTYAKG